MDSTEGLPTGTRITRARLCRVYLQVTIHTKCKSADATRGDSRVGFMRWLGRSSICYSNYNLSLPTDYIHAPKPTRILAGLPQVKTINLQDR